MLAAVLCLGGASAEVTLSSNATGFRSVIVEVHDDHGAEVVLAKFESQEKALRVQREQYPPNTRFATQDSHVHVMYHALPHHKELGQEPHHMLSFKNARQFHAHSWDTELEEFTSGFEKHDYACIDFVVPDHVDVVTIDDQILKKTFEVRIPLHTEIHAGKYSRHTRDVLQRGADILGEFDPVQIEDTNGEALPRAGPVETQQNFVFLSGGYTDQASFVTDLQKVVRILEQGCQGCPNTDDLQATIPFIRYSKTFNVFGVYQKSAEAGASVPQKGITVNNNLECSYGTVVHRALFCSPSKVIALADTASCGAQGKTNVVAIVLVNAADYGGAASYRPTVRVGSFSMKHFNLDLDEERGVFTSLFFHEVGHCYSDLMDEYDTGLQESTEITYPNCAFSTQIGETQWAYWLSFNPATWGANEKYYTLGPQTVCGWSNYVKPSGECFMEKLTSNGNVPRLCPVCREKSVTQFYATGMDITYPKCPLESQILYIDTVTPVHIFINKFIIALQNVGEGGSVSASWSCATAGGSSKTLTQQSTTDASFVVVNSTHFESCGGTIGTPINVSVTVKDETLWVQPNYPGMADWKTQLTQTYQWEVRRVADVTADSVGSNVTKLNCLGTDPTTSLPSANFPVNVDKATTEYYQQCRDGFDCQTTYSGRAYTEATAEVVDAAEDVESLILGPAGIGVGCGIIFFLVIWLLLARRCSYARTKSIFATKHDRFVGIIRKIIIISGIFFVLVSIACMVVGLMWYNDVGAFLKLVLIAAFILCICLFFMAFVGTVAAYYRAKVLLFINSFGLLCSLAVMCYATHVVNYVGQHITDGGCPQLDSAATQSPGTEATLLQPPCAKDDTDIAICGIEGVGCELRELWKTLVKNYPDKICAFQSELKCGGYTQPCNKGVSTDFCPVGCDSVNAEYGDACKVKLQDDIEEQCKKLFPFMIVLTIAMALAMMNNLSLACLLSRQQKAQHKQQRASLATYTDKMRNRQGDIKMKGTQNRALRLMRALSQSQRDKMQDRFKSADRDGNGTLDEREMRMFLRAVLCKDLTRKELDEVFTKADINKDGKLDFEEFCAAFKTDPREEYMDNDDEVEMTSPTSPGGPTFADVEKAGGASPNQYARFDQDSAGLAHNNTDFGGTGGKPSAFGREASSDLVVPNRRARSDSRNTSYSDYGGDSSAPVYDYPPLFFSSGRGFTWGLSSLLTAVVAPRGKTRYS